MLPMLELPAECVVYPSPRLTPARRTVSSGCPEEQFTRRGMSTSSLWLTGRERALYSKGKAVSMWKMSEALKGCWKSLKSARFPLKKFSP